MLIIPVLYFALSVITFIAYGADKARAVKNRRRISERTLHTLEFCGGWPGAVVAQQVFRHKRRKGGYMGVFAAIVGVHLAGWAWVIWRFL